MRCPYCYSDNDGVRDSRIVEDGKAIRRRRFCNHCHRRFTTYERVEGLLQVRKRDGTQQDFSRVKIERGLKAACWKRTISTEAVEKLAADIEAHVLDIYEKEVSSEDIGNLCMDFLRDFDQVAFVRFASAQNFVDELTPILKPQPKTKKTKKGLE
jgi:transcriptional repressor NrdR